MPNLYISNILPPYRVDLCNELHLRLGCEICHFSDDIGDGCFSREDIRSRSRFTNRIVPVRMFMGKPFLRNPESLIGEDTRIVFVNEYSPIALQMLQLRRKYGFKVVSFCDDSMDMLNGNDFSLVHTVARRIVPRWVDEIILPGNSVAQWYKEKFGKGIVMPIIADEDLMRARLAEAIPLSESIRHKYSLDDRRVVLFVGRLVGLKNLPRFFQAFAPLRERARLVVVGDGEERTVLEKLAGKLGIDALFVGSRFGMDLLAWYSIADILVLPSTREAFGAVTGEALTCGCRVMVSERAGSASLVREGENGLLVDPENMESMAGTLSRLLDMPSSPRGENGIRPNLLPVRFDDYIKGILEL